MLQLDRGHSVAVDEARSPREQLGAAAGWCSRPQREEDVAWATSATVGVDDVVAIIAELESTQLRDLGRH